MLLARAASDPTNCAICPSDGTCPPATPAPSETRLGGALTCTSERQDCRRTGWQDGPPPPPRIRRPPRPSLCKHGHLWRRDPGWVRPGVPAWSRRLQYGTLSRYFWTLPVAVRGSASRNSTEVGHWKTARRSRQKAINAPGSRSTPSRSTTSAFGVSPQRSCGTAITATSATSGCWCRHASTSSEETFSPAVTMTSFLRSVIRRMPWSRVPPSPVLNHSPSKAAS